ncbi:hypothetical protein DYB25_006030 [Aphanomyces astaci]|uniref:Glutathione peroxidase n=1 Tax=Aphanomyces astaci TaxID=112090 RepID=A0A396ZYU6_APHAT|nr:hypothetical protein DYB36_004026 [Aphanomyces astaci]RHY24758.1 hypothetical protein DYB25_006030 [Aphanomyces astaci]RHY43091.1 hypothetical protein DYB34_006618 [Aphanomyces astaci]RHY52720.1 hypothetical protein DYB38_010385 [Aphanomyces astaci]RHY74583.1 hypothetical protein DYB30_000002 [Aphanomyces astaci]
MASPGSATSKGWSFSGLLGRSFCSAEAAPHADDPTKAKSFFDLAATDMEGNIVPMSKYRGRVFNYTQLAELDTKYRDKGLQILAFPCNQFGGQEPGTNEEIMDFVKGFGITFPFFAKCDVNGSGTVPVFQYLKHHLGGLLGNFIKWNFTKFLVDCNGQPYQRYSPQTAPNDFEADIVELLTKQ